MAMEMRDIAVEEIMSKNPLLLPPETTVLESAKIMARRNVSTIIVVDDGNPVGIVTDRDFVTKVIAEGLDPEVTKLREIMSNPIIMIPSDESVSAAAKVMSRRRIRKLPVIKDGKIVGILSENDIVKISPDLIALAKEYAEIHRNGCYEVEEREYIAGKCEMCGQYSLKLMRYEGMLICPECYDSLR